jgi:hypothetical protein
MTYVRPELQTGGIELRHDCIATRFTTLLWSVVSCHDVKSHILDRGTHVDMKDLPGGNQMANPTGVSGSVLGLVFRLPQVTSPSVIPALKNDFQKGRRRDMSPPQTGAKEGSRSNAASATSVSCSTILSEN